MSHDKSPLEQALDLALFGPVGLALSAKDALPDWVATGRRRVLKQIDVARMVGEHATRHGQKVVEGTLVGLGILPGPPPPPPPARPSPRSDTTAPRDPPAPVAGTPDFEPTVAQPSPNGRGGVFTSPTASADLAIPGYDSLSASQVVPRLAGLAPAELEAVRSYEAASRGRRTILTKISQLQTGRS